MTTDNLLQKCCENKRIIGLDNEFQLMYTCAMGLCSYKKSVLQIIIKQKHGDITCVCGRLAIHHMDARIYSIEDLFLSFS